MNARWFVIPLLAVALAIGAACSNDDDPADSTAESTSNATQPATDGGSSDNSGSGDTADLGDFPVPAPGWADAISKDDGGPLSTVLFIVPLDQQDATIAFYEDWTANQPDEYLRTDSASGGVTFQNDVAVGEDKTIIAILSPLAGDDFVSVSLTFGAFE